MRVETLSSSWGCGLPYDLVSVVPSGFQMVKHATRHGRGELVLSQEHGTEVRATQQRGFFIGMGAEQDPDARVQRSRDLDHLPDPRRVRGGHHEHGRTRYVCLDEDGGLRRVARNGGDVPLTEPLDKLPVLLGDHEGSPPRPQRFRDSAAHPAVPHQHHVTGQRLRIKRGRQLGERVVALLQRARDARARPDPALRRLDGGASCC
jgi:hypothetical protein